MAKAKFATGDRVRHPKYGTATIKTVKESAYEGQGCYWIRKDNAIPGYMYREAFVPESELEAAND